MAVLSDERLPFTFEYPNCSELQWSKVGERDSILMVDNWKQGFNINLMWGPDYGPHAAPRAYTLLQIRSLPIDDFNSVNLLVARGPLRPILSLPSSIIRGAVVGLLLFFFARQWLDTVAIVLIGLAATAVFSVFRTIKGGTVKYAFIYDDTEYVFTGPWSSRKEMDNLISTIQFK